MLYTEKKIKSEIPRNIKKTKVFKSKKSNKSFLKNNNIIVFLDK